jgi:hypothetical protein
MLSFKYIQYSPKDQRKIPGQWVAIGVERNLLLELIHVGDVEHFWGK